MENEERDVFDVVKLEKDGGFLFIVFKNGFPLPGFYWDEEQASVSIEFETGVAEKKTHGKRLMATSARGLPPGYLIFELYDGGEFLGFVIWGPTGILPDVYASPEEAVAAAARQYEARRAPDPAFVI
jgi:hypothetical protein